MTRLRILAVAGLVPLLAVPATIGPAAGDDSDARTERRGPQSRAASLAVLEAGTMRGTSFVAAPRSAPQRAAQAPRATIRVNYNGFSQPARNAFQRAVDTWETRVSSRVPITVKATFEPLASGVLGSAGPSFIWRDFRGAPKKKTWYVDAIANKNRGKQLSPKPDILANFNSTFSNWHYGTGAPPAGTYDFESVVLHELGHGLGFLGLGQVSGQRGTIRFNNKPSAYDRLTENGGGKKLTRFADPSNALGQQLRSNSLFIDSQRIRNANNGNRAKIFAPRRFQPGSSYSHLNEATYSPGDPDSLMTPQLNDGEGIRTPGPIAKAIFRSTGW